MGLINYLQQAGFLHTHDWREPDIDRTDYWAGVYDVHVCEDCDRIVALPHTELDEFDAQAKEVYKTAQEDAEAAVSSELNQVYDHSSERVEVANAIMRTYERNRL